MKISKKLLALILAVLMTVSMVTVAVVNVSAAAGDKVYCRASFTPNCYMWNDSTKENNKAWPGVAMTKVSGETDVYCYTVPDDKFDMIIFNGSGQTDDLKYPGGNKLYDYATRTWSDYAPIPYLSSASRTRAAASRIRSMSVSLSPTRPPLTIPSTAAATSRSTVLST